MREVFCIPIILIQRRLVEDDGTALERKSKTELAGLRPCGRHKKRNVHGRSVSLGELFVSYCAEAGYYLAVFRGISFLRCRRGDLNPRPYANALNTSVTLIPHCLHISMRYPSNLHMPYHQNH